MNLSIATLYPYKNKLRNKFCGKHSPFLRSCMDSLLFFLFCLNLLILSTSANAHHPHDKVDALVLSPAYTQNSTLYIANSEHMFKSENGGYAWQELVNGLDHTSPISTIEITRSLDGSDILFVATLGNGVYRSINNGKSWASINKGLQSLGIQEIFVRSSNTILALDTQGRIYIFDSSNDTWQLTSLPDNTIITALSLATQSNRKNILAGDNSGNVFLSANNGANWKLISKLPAKTEITVINFDPSDTSNTSWFVGTKDNGLFKTANNGKSYRNLNKGGLSNDQIMSLAFSENYNQDHTLAVTTWHKAIFISNDLGENWNQYSDGLTTDKQADTAMYLSPYFRQIKMVPGNSEIVFLAGFDGLFKSETGGKNWFELETLPVSLIKGLAVSASKNGNYSLGITTYGGGAYISHDHGESWLISNNGLKTSRLMDIQFSPAYHKDQTIFTGSKGLLLKSTDRGNSWEQIQVKYSSLKSKIFRKLVTLGLPKRFADPYTKSSSLPAYPTIMAAVPDYADSNTVLFGTRWHGMYKSIEGGQKPFLTWEHTTGAVTALSVSPDFANDNTAIIFVRDSGVYKSIDKGESWIKVANGLPFGERHSNPISESLKHKDFDIAFSPAYNRDKTLFVAGPLGLYVSRDKGDNWDKISNTALGMVPNIIAIGLSPDYANDATLLVSLKGLGMYKSADGGKSFVETGRNLIQSNNSIEHIAFSHDFAVDSTIYAASDQNLYLSNDLGENWVKLQRPVRYENHRDVIKYKGNWISETSPTTSTSSVHYSMTEGDQANLAFNGCGIRWIATQSSVGGMANVYIDNSFVTTVDLYTNEIKPMSSVFNKPDLTCGAHKISIEVIKRKDKKPGNRVELDAFDVVLAN